MSAETIHNLIRAITHPYVGAHFVWRSQICKVWNSELKEKRESKKDLLNIEPGKVLRVNENSIIVKCGDVSIKLLEIDPMPEVIKGDYL